MRRLDLILRVRSYTRDFSNSIFREADIVDYLNEGIDRFKQIVPELKNLTYLLTSTQVPELIPSEYHHLLSLFAASRCFAQDEGHYRATTLMNEFEVKLQEFLSRIESGHIKILDASTGLPIVLDEELDYVKLDSYWGTEIVDLDDGVEGVE